VTRLEVLADIKAHPERHRHDFEALQRCCFVDGAFDCGIMEAHEGLPGEPNVVDAIGGIAEGKPFSVRGPRCDVTSGPCACGAWH